MLPRTLLESYLKATRIGEEREGIKPAAGAQFRMVTSPAFSPNANKQCPKRGGVVVSVTYSAIISPLFTLKDGRNYDIVIFFSDFRLIGFLVHERQKKKKNVASSCEV